MSEKTQMRMKLDATKAQINLVAAVLVGPAGRRKIVSLEIATVDGVQKVKDFIDEVHPVLKKKEKIFMIKYTGVSTEQLEAVASHVRLLD